MCLSARTAYLDDNFLYFSEDFAKRLQEEENLQAAIQHQQAERSAAKSQDQQRRQQAQHRNESEGRGRGRRDSDSSSVSSGYISCIFVACGF